MASFRSLAARKAIFLLALILMASPVAGPEIRIAWLIAGGRHRLGTMREAGRAAARDERLADHDGSSRSSVDVKWVH